MTANDNDAVFTVSELAKRWKCDRKSVIAAIKSGELAAFKVGQRAYRISADEVARYEKQRAA